MERAIILYVDDVPMHLKYFVECMGRYFEVVTAESGVRGLEVLQGQKVDAIVTDQQMEKMSGIEFLKEAQKIVPEVARIMLTAYPNEEVVVQGVNEGRIHGFFSKPIRNREWDLKGCIDREILLNRQRGMIHRQNEELRERVNEVKLSKEKDVAIARLESRHRVVNELGHRLRNPFTPVYTCYQMLGEMWEQYREGKLSDTEKLRMFEQAMKMIGIAAPEMERLYKDLRHLERFIQDETDPAGDGIVSEQKVR